MLTGCSPSNTSDDSDVYPHDVETLFSERDYPQINQLLGHPTYQDITDDILVFFDTSKALEAQGKSNKTDLSTMIAIGNNFYYLIFGSPKEPDTQESLGEDEYVAGLMGDGLLEIVTIASDTDVGETMNEFNEMVGPDFLVTHIYPMLEYAFEYFQDGSDQGAGKISQEDFSILMSIFRSMLDKSDPLYGPILAVTPSLWEMLDIFRAYGEGIQLRDLQNILDWLLDRFEPEEDKANSDLFDEIIDAIGDLLDEGSLVIEHRLTEHGTLEFDNNNRPIKFRDPADYLTLTFKDETRRLAFSSGLFMSNKIPDDINGHDQANGWENMGPMTDLARVLLAVEDLLDPAVLDRTEFEAFLDGIITASAGADGANSLGGILRGLAETEPAYLQGLDYSVEILFKQNREGIFRDDPLAKSETSTLRVLLAMLEYIDTFSLFSLLNAGLSLGSLEGPGPCDYTTLCPTLGIYGTCSVNGRGRILPWGLGEISNALDCQAGTDDYPFKGFDHVFHQRPYVITYALPLPVPFPGLLGMFNELAGVGGLTPFFNSAFVALGDEVVDGNHVTGYKHQMLGPVAPMMQHFWKWSSSSPGEDWVDDVVNVMVALNEISTPVNVGGFLPNFRTDQHYFNGKFVPCSGVLKTVEGVDGYGLATYLMRDHSIGKDAVDTGIPDPIFNMISMLVNKLIDTPYEYDGCHEPCILYCDDADETCTLFSAFMDYLENNKVLGIDVDSMDDMENNRYKVISNLFDPDDDGDVYLDDLRSKIVENHNLFTIFTWHLGNMLIAVAQDEETYNSITDDIDTIVMTLKLLGFLGSDVQSGAKGLLDHLSKENQDGTDNPFIANAKVILYKAFDIKSDTHNPVGEITKDNSVSELVNHLFGDETLVGGIYSMFHVKDFTDEVEDSDVDIFGLLIEEPLEEFFVKKPGITDGDDLPSLRFYSSFFIPVDVDGNGVLDKPIAYLLLRAFRLENTDMNGLMGEMADLFYSPALYPGGYLHEVYIDMMAFAEENMTD